jgi:hypothetical protein
VRGDRSQSHSLQDGRPAEGPKHPAI